MRAVAYARGWLEGRPTRSTSRKTDLCGFYLSDERVGLLSHAGG